MMKFLCSCSLTKLLMGLMISFSPFALAKDGVKHSPDKIKLEQCLASARKFENMKTKSEEELWANLQKSQDYYLCAEKEGDTFAGVKAASFSDAGVAKQLDKKEILRLYTNAANASNSPAALTLSTIYCGDVPGVCNQPMEAKKWLIKAVSLGNSDAMNELGAFYARGYDGEVDTDKAFACYKSAAERGSDLGKSNFEELMATAKPSPSIKCL